jgi:hypothetical protein
MAAKAKGHKMILFFSCRYVISDGSLIICCFSFYLYSMLSSYVMLSHHHDVVLNENDVCGCQFEKFGVVLMAPNVQAFLRDSI